MDGLHDMGGMHGFGRIAIDREEPVFHADWERRVFALTSAAPFTVPYTDDQLRPAIESMDALAYARSSYYEKWLDALVRLLKERGAISEAELAGGPLEPLPPALTGNRPVPADKVLEAIWAGASQARPATAGTPVRFRPGDAVRVRQHAVATHNRMPRYVRGRVGRIERLAGTFLVADANALGQEEVEALYTVVFDQPTLWSAEARPGDTLSLDLWDRYLEPV